jgi:hypothetical protein
MYPFRDLVGIVHERDAMRLRLDPPCDHRYPIDNLSCRQQSMTRRPFKVHLTLNFCATTREPRRSIIP